MEKKREINIVETTKRWKLSCRSHNYCKYRDEVSMVVMVMIFVVQLRDCEEWIV